MTIKCKECGDIPLNYIMIDNRSLCVRCAREEYKKKLERLERNYPECIKGEKK